MGYHPRSFVTLGWLKTPKKSTMPSLLVYKEISTSSDLGLILLLAEKPSKKISKTDQISLQFSAGEQLLSIVLKSLL